MRAVIDSSGHHCGFSVDSDARSLGYAEACHLRWAGEKNYDELKADLIPIF